MSITGIVVGFGMHNRVPHRQRGNWLLAVSGATLLVVVTAVAVVAFGGQARPAARILPNEAALLKPIKVSKSVFATRRPAPERVEPK